MEVDGIATEVYTAIDTKKHSRLSELPLFINLPTPWLPSNIASWTWPGQPAWRTRASYFAPLAVQIGTNHLLGRGSSFPTLGPSTFVEPSRSASCTSFGEGQAGS